MALGKPHNLVGSQFPGLWIGDMGPTCLLSSHGCKDKIRQPACSLTGSPPRAYVGSGFKALGKWHNMFWASVSLSVNCTVSAELCQEEGCNGVVWTVLGAVAEQCWCGWRNVAQLKSQMPNGTCLWVASPFPPAVPPPWMLSFSNAEALTCEGLCP